MKKNIREIVGVALAIALVLGLMGCAVDPMIAYVEELEKTEVIEEMSKIDDGVISLNEQFISNMESVTVEGMEECREMTNELVGNITRVIDDLQGLNTSDATVKAANNYLIDYFNYLNDGISEFYVMIDAMIELNEIEANLTQPGVEERLDDIINSINNAEDDAQHYLQLADDALANWSAIVED